MHSSIWCSVLVILLLLLAVQYGNGKNVTTFVGFCIVERAFNSNVLLYLILHNLSDSFAKPFCDPGILHKGYFYFSITQLVD